MTTSTRFSLALPNIEPKLRPEIKTLQSVSHLVQPSSSSSYAPATRSCCYCCCYCCCCCSCQLSRCISATSSQLSCEQIKTNTDQAHSHVNQQPPAALLYRYPSRTNTRPLCQFSSALFDSYSCLSLAPRRDTKGLCIMHPQRPTLEPDHCEQPKCAHHTRNQHS